MKKIYVTIENKKYALKYGYGAYRILCEFWKVKKLSQLATKFQKLGFKENVEPGIEQYDRLGEIILAGILNVDGSADLNRNDCIDYFLHNADRLTEVIEAFLYSFPTDQNPEKPKK